MNPVKVALGLAGLAFASRGVLSSIENLQEGLRGPTPRKGGGQLLHQGTHERTLAGPIRTTRRAVGSLDDRLAEISRLAHEGKFDPHVIAWTRKQLTRKCRPGNNGEQWCVPEKNTLAEIRAIFEGLRREVRYTSDIAGADTYQHPRVTLKLGTADCDDFSSLACASLMAIGIPCRFKVIRTRDSKTWNHIYVQADADRIRGGKWVSLDASVPNKFGWEAPSSMVAASRVYDAY